MLEELKPMIDEWQRTKSIHQAALICEKLAEILNETADDEAAGCTFRYTDADSSES